MNLVKLNISSQFYHYSLNEDKKNDFDKAKVIKRIDKIIKEFIKNNEISDLNDIKKISIGENKIVLTNGKNETKELNCEDKKLFEAIENLCPEKKLDLILDQVSEKIIKLAKKDKTLYLYSSGGGGHKSAKDAKIEHYFEKLIQDVKAEFNPKKQSLLIEEKNETDIIDDKFSEAFTNDERLKNPLKLAEWCKQIGLVHETDVLHDYLGKIGKWSSQQWDKAQQKGDVLEQEKLASKQWLSDLMFGPIIFFSTLHNLRKTHVNKVVSTQAMATGSILLAIKYYNMFFKPKESEDVKLHLYLTDMPTKEAKHFFVSIKQISKNEAKDLILYSPKPKDSNTDWSSLCGLENDQVRELDIKDLPVRLDFLNAIEDFKKNTKSDAFSPQIKVTDKSELDLLNQVLKAQGRDQSIGDASKVGVQTFDYPFGEKDKGYFIMLGSQPTESAIQSYVDQFIKLSKTNQDTNYHIFAFTGKFDEHHDCFYKRLANYLMEKKQDWPKNLKVLPLSYQNPKQLVSLEMSCDTITRSGGATIMELLALNEIPIDESSKRKRFIHAQKIPDRESLEESVPLWERGNYFFLRDILNKENEINSQVVDPDSILSVIEPKDA